MGKTLWNGSEEMGTLQWVLSPTEDLMESSLSLYRSKHVLFTGRSSMPELAFLARAWIGQPRSTDSFYTTWPWKICVYSASGSNTGAVFQPCLTTEWDREEGVCVWWISKVLKKYFELRYCRKWRLYIRSSWYETCYLMTSWRKVCFTFHQQFDDRIRCC